MIGDKETLRRKTCISFVAYLSDEEQEEEFLRQRSLLDVRWKKEGKREVDDPGRIRTCNLPIRSRTP
jgi:hypothetical protein